MLYLNKISCLTICDAAANTFDLRFLAETLQHSLTELNLKRMVVDLYRAFKDVTLLKLTKLAYIDIKDKNT